MTGSQTGRAVGERRQTIQAREEELKVEKESATGEVIVRKDVKTEHRSIDVPVQEEEVVIERHPVAGQRAPSGPIGAGGEVRVPVKEEHVRVEKHPVVKEEVTIGKRATEDTEKVDADVKKEEIKVEKRGNPKVRDED
jgi:uncharacterized protein (TIGR02271 family)